MEGSLELKIIATSALFILTLIFSYLPYFIKVKFKSSGTVMSYLNCAAGGVVLGALLIHMLPHIVNSEKAGEEARYPFGAVCAGLSFLLLFAIDRLFLLHCPMNNNCTAYDLASNAKAVPELKEKEVYSKAQAFIFVLALSVHSFLEGLGLATHEKITSYLIGLFSHKWLEAFALGVSIVNASFSHLHTFFLIISYSLLTPLGIMIGLIVHGFIDASSEETAAKVLNGLAAGSFLFVSCIEMIPPEFQKLDSQSRYKFCALTLGFLFIALITILDP